jgi:hypothetical protein
MPGGQDRVAVLLSEFRGVIKPPMIVALLVPVLIVVVLPVAIHLV